MDPRGREGPKVPRSPKKEIRKKRKKKKEKRKKRKRKRKKKTEAVRRVRLWTRGNARGPTRRRRKRRTPTKRGSQAKSRAVSRRDRTRALCAPPHPSPRYLFFNTFFLFSWCAQKKKKERQPESILSPIVGSCAISYVPRGPCFIAYISVVLPCLLYTSPSPRDS